jgi:hypothetical protein
MIGDAKAHGAPRNSKTNPFKTRRGRSAFQLSPTSTGKNDTQGGGDEEVAKVAKRSTKGMRPGIGLPRHSVVEPFREKNSRGQSFKTVAPRAANTDSGAAVDRWCRGQTKGYR